MQQRYKLQMYERLVHKQIIRLTLGACVAMGLVACHDKQQPINNTQALNKSTQYQLKVDCADLVQTWNACPAQRLTKESQSKMMAVLEEQMRELPVPEAKRRCQELQDFWKVACGVANTQ